MSHVQYGLSCYHIHINWLCQAVCLTHSFVLSSVGFVVLMCLNLSRVFHVMPALMFACFCLLVFIAVS